MNKGQVICSTERTRIAPRIVQIRSDLVLNGQTEAVFEFRTDLFYHAPGRTSLFLLFPDYGSLQVSHSGGYPIGLEMGKGTSKVRSY